MKINSKIIAVVIAVIMVGGIILSDALGFWETETVKQPNKLVSGEYDAEDIRGSYTFLDIENSFDITSETLAQAFGIVTENPDEVAVNSFESIFTNLGEDIEIGTSSVAFFVALYTDTPFTVYAYLPQSAYDLLISENRLSSERAEILKDYIVPTELVYYDNLTITEETEEEEEIGVKGKTTYNDLLDYGLTSEEIDPILGGAVSVKGMLIRDICTDRGLSFSVVKEQINALLTN
ncbi:MAG: hypothetical protein JXQ23_11980 [Clostridia bacterium]|nr:hypothetical protein [Clostridia bacterium]